MHPTPPKPEAAPEGLESPRANDRRRLLRGGLAAGPVLMTIASRPVLGQTICTSASAMGSINPSGARTAAMCSGLTPEQWKAIPTQWPTPYTATTGDGTVASAGTTTAGTTAGTTTQSGTTVRRSGITYQGGSTTGGMTYQGGSTAGGTTSQGGSTTTSGGTPQQQATAFHCPTTGLSGRVYGDRTMIEVIDLGNSNGLGRYIVAALLNARAGRTPVLHESTVRNMWNDVVHRGYYEPTAGSRWGPAEIVAYLKTTMG